MTRTIRPSRQLPAVIALVAAMLAATLTAMLAGPSPASAQAGENRPVVFVHGYLGSASNWTTAERVFEAGGYDDRDLFAFEYNSFGNNRTNAERLRDFVEQVKRQTGASQVDIVNHSMGGLVTQYYLKELGGTSSTAHVASIAGANHGTTYAAACLIFVTCQQMYPGSLFILTITAGDETPGPTEYATWYSPCDGIIIPYTNTVLDGADNNYVVCQTHLGFLEDRVVLREIRDFVSS